MKQKLLTIWFLSFIAMTPDAMLSLYAIPAPRTVQLPLTLSFDKEKIQGGERVRARATRSGDTSQPVTLRLESTQPNLIVVPKSAVVINRGESFAVFELISVSTPIKTTVSIRAFLPSSQVPAIRSIEMYPAILKSVTLNNPSLPGTRGGEIGVRVELNANAPVGGIELYLDLTGPRLLRLDGPNPRLTAGRREGTFDIEYDKLYIGEDQISSGRTNFDAQTRTLDLVVSLEVQSTKPWADIPGIAKKISFDALPLRVASISVQSAAVSGGGESLASFTLNIPPGSSERVLLSPTSVGTSLRPVWARLLGTSCQANVLILELQLTQGVTNYSFKVCTAPVTTATTGTLTVTNRSAAFPVQIAVQP
ncbi:MAG: hypothetical protein ACR2IB_05345 [Pyrinomonadaceae bacterium]